MKLLHSALGVVAVASALLASVSPAFAANTLPVVNTFTLAASANSPIPVLAFTATDNGGTVVGYMCNDNSTKPLATDSRWTAAAPTTCSTTKNGSVIMYGWAKDNAAGVSAGKTFTTWVPGTHTHVIANVQGLQTALDGKAALAHNHDSVYQKKYANVIVVATSGGDFADPIAAMNSITDASAVNPYLVKVMPGTYQLGSNTLGIPAYVDLEGSGEGTTSIAGTGATLVSSITGSEIRSLTLESTADSSYFHTYGIATSGSRSKITDVTLRMVTGSPQPTAISALGSTEMNNVNISFASAGECLGIRLAPGSANEPTTLTNVQITLPSLGVGWGVGLTSEPGYVVVDNLIVRAPNHPGWLVGWASNGPVAGQQHTLIRNSDIQGEVRNDVDSLTVVNSRMGSLLQYDAGAITRVSFSEIDGTVTNDSGNGLSCFNVHDGSLSAITCP